MKNLLNWFTKPYRDRLDAEAMWQLCRTEYKKDASWVYHNLMSGSSYDEIRRITHGR